MSTGRLDRDLTAGILKPAGTRRSLPRGVGTDQVAALLGVCDPATALGARDRALVMILVRLGLRAGEAARLRLDDIDWASGHLRVTGKGREHSLPLPVDVGQALEAWLRLRPPALDRAVFVRMRAPRQMMTTSGISGIIARLSDLAGIDRIYAHRLRHTAAMDVLAAGGTLTEAKELLGHAHRHHDGLRESRPRVAARAGRPVRAGAAMTTLRERLDDYLGMRRSLGFQLNDLERQVGLFCTWLEARGQTKTFTIDDAVAWARLNPDAHPSWWATRLSLVRRFAAYLNANDVDVPVIPSGLLPASKPRAVPFIYSQDDIDALLAACDTEFADERIAATLRTVIGLLAATGLRIGEALNLRVPTSTSTTTCW